MERIFLITTLFIICTSVAFGKHECQEASDSLKKVIRYYDTGEIRSITYANNDNTHIDSVFIIYYKNGQIKSFSEIEDGKPKGESREYYENGKLESIGNYDGYTPIGKHLKYDREGNIIEVRVYANDGTLLSTSLQEN